MRELSQPTAETPKVSLHEQIVKVFNLPTALYNPTAKDKKSFTAKEFKTLVENLTRLVKDREGWKGFDKGRVAQAIHHFLLADPKPFRHRGDSDVISASSSSEHDGPRRFFSCAPEGDHLHVTAAQQKFEYRKNMRSSTSIDPLLHRLIDAQDTTFQITEKTEMEGGVWMDGIAAQSSNVQISLDVRNAADLLRGIQAIHLYPAVRAAVDQASQERIYQVATYDGSGRVPPFEYEGEFFFDLVEKSVLEAVQRLLTQRPEFAGILKDFNAEITPIAITPVVVYSEYTDFLGHPMLTTKKLELPAIPLKHPLPLTINKLRLEQPKKRFMDSDEHVDIDLLPTEIIPVQFSFYPWNDQAYSGSHGGHHLKSHLHIKLATWINQKFPRQRSRSAPEVLKDTAYYLRLIGVTEQTLEDAGPAGQYKLLRNRLRELLQEFHPDRFNGADAETVASANELTRELLDAQRFLLERFPASDNESASPADVEEPIRPDMPPTPKKLG